MAPSSTSYRVPGPVGSRAGRAVPEPGFGWEGGEHWTRLCLGGKAGEESEGESERSQSATAGTRVLARPSWGRLSSSQNAAGQGM